MPEISGQHKPTSRAIIGVAVILTVVGAVVYSSIKQGRRALHEDSCLSNLKQIGKASLMYVQDNDGEFPPAYTAYMDVPMHEPWTSFNGRVQSWYWLLQPYLGSPMAHDAGWTYVSQLGHVATPKSMGVDESYLPEHLGSPWHCPLDLDAPNVSYGLNGMVAGAVNIWNDVPPRRLGTSEASKRMADIRDPARVIWAGDTNRMWSPEQARYAGVFPDWMRHSDFGSRTMTSDEFTSWYAEYLKADYTDYKGVCGMAGPSGCRGPAYRHDRTGMNTGSTTVVYCDGHAAAIPFGKMTLENIFPNLSASQISRIRPYQHPLPQYTVTDIGALAGQTTMHCGGLSDSGHVVGGSRPNPGIWSDDAILWKDGRIRDLGKLPGGSTSVAYGVNDADQIVGDADDADDVGMVAFICEHGKMRKLGDLPGFTQTVARAINNRGQVVGRAVGASTGRATDAPAHAFLWENGAMRDLGVPAGCRSTWAYGINASGDVVGSAITNDDKTHAFVWTHGVMRDIGTLPGGTLSKAYGINASGQVVGDSDVGTKMPDGKMIFHAFLWQNGIMRDLGILPGCRMCKAAGINDRGEVVGNTILDGGVAGTPFIWDPVHGMRWLDRLMPDDQAWYPYDVYAINNRGQILAHAVHGQLDQRLALLTPTKQQR
jgi:probable HAF family extracellular repeat protein